METPRRDVASVPRATIVVELSFDPMNQIGEIAGDDGLSRRIEALPWAALSAVESDENREGGLSDRGPERQEMTIASGWSPSVCMSRRQDSPDGENPSP